MQIKGPSRALTANVVPSSPNNHFWFSDNLEDWMSDKRIYPSQANRGKGGDKRRAFSRKNDNIKHEEKRLWV